MEAQYTAHTLMALVAPWYFLKLNLLKMTSDGSETYANVFKMSIIPKINYPCIKIGWKTKNLSPKQFFPHCPLKTSSKTGGTLVKSAKVGETPKLPKDAPKLVDG